jgi:hypothetical protein
MKNAPRSFTQPLWRGEPIEGKRILLHAEQGLGDTLQFLRYVPMVQARGGAVVLDVQGTLRRLAAQLPGLSVLISQGEAGFDWQCPLMSLPLAFGTTVDTIPADIPYLTIPEEAQQAAARRDWPEEGIRIGLVWSGNPKYVDDQSRSIPLTLFAQHVALEGAHLYSLQLGAAAEQIDNAGVPVTDLREAIGDMADTAALVQHLDLVITVDTAVAHLAGALGRRTWILLPFAPDWRWLTQRQDSPWYPTARLFRQPRPGDWDAVMANVREALIALMANTERQNAHG